MADKGRAAWRSGSAASSATPADQLAQLGLISVELVANALKHGQVSVRVEAKRDADCLQVTV